MRSIDTRFVPLGEMRWARSHTFYISLNIIEIERACKKYASVVGAHRFEKHLTLWLA